MGQECKAAGESVHYRPKFPSNLAFVRLVFDFRTESGYSQILWITVLMNCVQVHHSAVSRAFFIRLNKICPIVSFLLFSIT